MGVYIGSEGNTKDTTENEIVRYYMDKQVEVWPPGYYGHMGIISGDSESECLVITVWTQPWWIWM